MVPALDLGTLRKSGPLTEISNHEELLGYSEEGLELKLPCGLPQAESHPALPHSGWRHKLSDPTPPPSLFLCVQGDLAYLSTGFLSGQPLPFLGAAYPTLVTFPTR